MSKREKVYLVDKNDTVVGEKWRDELTDQDCWRVISIWITDEEGKILLQQRSFTKKVGPGIWSAACEGTIEAGDSVRSTAVRELEEEIGLAVNSSELLETTKLHYKDPQFGWRIKYGFTLQITQTPIEEFTLQKEEVEQVKWVTPDGLNELYKNTPEKFPRYKQYQALISLTSRYAATRTRY